MVLKAASLNQNTPGSEGVAIFPSRAVRKGHSGRRLSQHHQPAQLPALHLPNRPGRPPAGQTPETHIHHPTAMTSPGLSWPWRGLAKRQGSTWRGRGWGQRCFSRPQPGGLPQVCSPFRPLNPHLHKLGSRVLTLHSSET